MLDFLEQDLAVGDFVITSFGKPWNAGDIFEYCKIVRFTEKAVIVERLKIIQKNNKQKRVISAHLIKVDPAQHTMYTLKKQKETI